MAKKIKLTDAARDLQISPKELVSFLEERLGEKKTTSSSITEREFNLMLEFYSQKVNVNSFDDYFASKKSAFVSETKKENKQEPKKEFKKKNQDKKFKSQKQGEKSSPKEQTKSVQTPKEQAKPVQAPKEQAKPVQAPKEQAKPVQAPK
ncbi:MAG: translation initiation factor IF-2 N-terminal domain-containing protein, partial [Oscillospiraceae bacterium]|nr:translation initiation factor IF-2 N-terminal domain-containing protein [Oscillospiraceae bacterium]